PILLAPARDFAITGICALFAAYLIPTSQKRGQAAALRKLIRNDASIVLACLTVTVFLLSWFGNRLDPRRTEGSADRSRVYVRVALPSGTTLDQTTEVASRIEKDIRTLEGVKRFWTYAGAGYA